MDLPLPLLGRDARLRGTEGFGAVKNPPNGPITDTISQLAGMLGGASRAASTNFAILSECG